ncbi:hypothetical protein ACLOJK_034371 [Asimina triloba]
MGELPSQSESNLNEHCEAIALGSEKRGDDQLDRGNHMEVADEIEAPNVVKFVSQLEEAEKVEQELSKSYIPVMPYTPPSVNYNEKNVSQIKLKTLPHSIRSESKYMIFGASPEHQYGAPSSSPKPAAMAAGDELPGGDADDRSKPLKMTAQIRLTPMISVHHGCLFFHDAKSRWVKTHLAEPITPTTARLHHNLFRPGNPSSPFDPAQIDAQEHHAHHVGHPRAIRLMKTSPLPEIQPQRPAPSNPATIRPIL